MSDVQSTTATAKPKREAKAEHTLLDANGKVVDDMELAHGIGYKDLGSNIGTTFIPTNPDCIRMLAVFGAKTLATNTASQTRQKDGNAQDEIDSIDDVFAYMNDAEVGKPQWRDSTREAGPRWNPDTLAQACVDVSVADGKLADAAAQAAAKSKLVAKFNDPTTGMEAQKKMRAVKGVLAAYQALTGKAAGTTDDIMAMVG